jgi:hypothetical protein
MKNCHSCGYENEEDAHDCPCCGASLVFPDGPPGAGSPSSAAIKNASSVAGRLKPPGTRTVIELAAISIFGIVCYPPSLFLIGSLTPETIKNCGAFGWAIAAGFESIATSIAAMVLSLALWLWTRKDPPALWMALLSYAGLATICATCLSAGWVGLTYVQHHVGGHVCRPWSP